MGVGTLSARVLGGGVNFTLTNRASRRTAMSAMAVGAGIVGLGAAGTGAALYEARHASRQWQRSRESTVMGNILATAQEGPFGTGARPYGMGPNFSNSAGMSLAMHYARNGVGMKNPFFSLAGMGGQGSRMAGMFLENI